jgi:acyl-CoA hydrolase
MSFADWPSAEMTEIIMPGDTNHLGTAFGGKIMQWVDLCAAIAAQRFAGGVVVTASIDSLEFWKPIKLGNIVTLQASINAAWRTSMEVGVKVMVEDPMTNECFQACRAYLTFVALNGIGGRREVEELPISDDSQHKRRRTQAEERRRMRLELRTKV